MLKKHKYIDGEVHHYLGQEYTLQVVNSAAKPRMLIVGSEFLELQINKPNNKKKREEVIYDWYRQEMQNIVTDIFSKWEKIINVKPSKIGLRKMKTRWGSCNYRTKKIWLNLELVKRPLLCIEYVVVHELMHLLEPSHNKRFKELMSKYLPEWKDLKKLLNEQTMKFTIQKNL